MHNVKKLIFKSFEAPLFGTVKEKNHKEKSVNVYNKYIEWKNKNNVNPNDNMSNREFIGIVKKVGDGVTHNKSARIGTKICAVLIGIKFK